MLASLLLRLFLFLSLRAEPGEVDPPEGGDGGDADPPEGGTLDDLLDEPDADAAGGNDALLEGDDPKPEKITAKSLKERLDRTERELAEEKAERRRKEQSAPAPAPQQDPDYEREEAYIADLQKNGATAEQLQWNRWQIGLNRESRQTKRDAQNALFQAQNLADRTQFEKLEITEPELYKRFEKQVNERHDAIIAKGQPPVSRMALLTYMVGEARMNAKKKTTSSPRKARAAEDGKGVDRGRLPGARSDVSGRASTKNERDKRRERLSNQPI